MQPIQRGGTRREVVLAHLALLILCAGVMACNDFERSMWTALRGADATVESLTRTYEKWRDAHATGDATFTAAEIESFRAGVNAANEAVGAGEGAYTAYWETKKFFAQGTATAAELEAKKRALSSAIESAKRSVAAARMIFETMNKKKIATVPAQSVKSADYAGMDWALIILLLGNLATAFLNGKSKLITEAALDLIAHVVEAVKEATGEDIELALPALRARVEARRKRLAAPAAAAGDGADPDLGQ